MNIFNRKPKQPKYQDLSDSELVELAKSDQEAFGELYERYVKKIYNYIYYRTSNQHDAEDLTARVFFRAMGHIENYTEFLHSKISFKGFPVVPLGSEIFKYILIVGAMSVIETSLTLLPAGIFFP